MSQSVAPSLLSRLNDCKSGALLSTATFCQGELEKIMKMNYAGECDLTHSRKASSMRVCQPAPEARKYASTSGLYRTVTGSLVGRLLRPRRRAASFSRSSGNEWLTIASFQNASTVAALFGSYGQSGSSTRSGAAARAAAICSALKGGLEIADGFIFITIAARNYVRPGGTIRPDQEHDTITKPAKTLPALFAISHAGIFPGAHEPVEHPADIRQINAVLGKIGLALGFIVSDHAQIVVTCNVEVKQFVTTFAPAEASGYARKKLAVDAITKAARFVGLGGGLQQGCDDGR